MNRIVSDNSFTLPLRARATPIVATIFGSTLAALPIVADAASLPPLGLVIALCWRLLRPEYWRAWMALPLGFVDDLLTGNPPGSGAMLWTMLFLGLDAVDSRLIFRGYALEWLIATAGFGFVIIGNWIIVGTMFGGQHLATILTLALPQIVLAALVFPAAMRLTAWLDRWRLKTS